MGHMGHRPWGTWLREAHDDNFAPAPHTPPGPALAGLMAERFGLSSPFLLCGAFLLGTSGACYLFLPETRTASATETDSATPVDSSSGPQLGRRRPVLL
jgi:hypothetical protein